jgi:Leucine-rich repeat (LRR) protein
MKKYLLCLICFCFYFKIFAQHIDDAGFALGIRYQCPKCIDSANNLTDAARIQTHLTVSLLNVADLKGIEGFSLLSSINCTDSKLTTLPANMPSTLQYINVEFNEITSLPTLPSNLKRFDCSNNLLKSLPNLPSTLQILDCSYNQISALPSVLPYDLMTLFCTNNLLTKLPTLPPKLEGLMCSYNSNLKIIPALPSSLIRLSCQYTDVKCLPFLPTNLTYLDISKTIVCVPNIITTLGIDVYEGFKATATNLPLCNDLRPPPCDTFPRSVSTKDTSKTVNNAQIAIKIDIFPNPTEGSVKIKCTNCKIKKVSVFNTIGQLIFETNTAILDFSNLGTTIYIVRVETENGEKIIKKIMRI